MNEQPPPSSPVDLDALQVRTQVRLDGNNGPNIHYGELMLVREHGKEFVAVCQGCHRGEPEDRMSYQVKYIQVSDHIFPKRETLYSNCYHLPTIEQIEGLLSLARAQQDELATLRAQELLPFDAIVQALKTLPLTNDMAETLMDAVTYAPFVLPSEADWEASQAALEELWAEADAIQATEPPAGDSTTGKDASDAVDGAAVPLASGGDVG